MPEDLYCHVFKKSTRPYSGSGIPELRFSQTRNPVHGLESSTHPPIHPLLCQPEWPAICQTTLSNPLHLLPTPPNVFRLPRPYSVNYHCNCLLCFSYSSSKLVNGDGALLRRTLLVLRTEAVAACCSEAPPAHCVGRSVHARRPRAGQPAASPPPPPHPPRRLCASRASSSSSRARRSLSSQQDACD